MRRYSGLALRAALVAVVALLVPACARDHDGDESSPYVTPLVAIPGAPSPPAVIAVHEIEPNDTAEEATKLALGFAGEGSQAVPGLDYDHWRVFLPVDAVVRVQLFAHRVSQEAWRAGGTAPLLDVMDGEGLAVIQAAYGGAGDPEIPGLFLAAGQYLMRVSKTDPAMIGGRYVLLVSVVDGAQVEWESLGGTSNDTPALAQPLTDASGFLAGLRETLHDDFYVVPVPGPSMLRLQYRAQQMSADFDPVLELLDPEGQRLALFDDGMGLPGVPGRDALGSYAFVEPGKYFLRCGAALAEHGGRYVLEWTLVPATVSGTGGQVGIAPGSVAHGALTGPGESDRFAFMAGPGDQLLVDVCDDATFPGGDAVVVDIVRAADDTPIAQASFSRTDAVNVHNVRAVVGQWGKYCVRVRPDATPSPTEYMLGMQVVRTGPYEPAKDVVLSQLPPLGVVVGAIDPVSDTDGYAFAAAANEFVVFRLVGGAPAAPVSPAHEGWGSSIQGRLTILDAKTRQVLAATEPALTACAQGSLIIDATVELAFVAAHGGPFLVYVAEATGAGGPEHVYVLDRD